MRMTQKLWPATHEAALEAEQAIDLLYDKVFLACPEETGCLDELV